VETTVREMGREREKERKRERKKERKSRFLAALGMTIGARGHSLEMAV
jgi:hypothetical protein